MTPFVLAACSSTSGSLGQAFEGRILQLTVVEMDRADELRYSTIDPLDVIRRWRMQPSKDDLELLLMRVKVENYIAVNAVFVSDQQAAILRGFIQDEYRPLNVTDTVYLDARGQPDTTVNVANGECFDHSRVVVNAGTNVRWTNSGDTDSNIQFGPGVLPGLGDEPIQIAPGASVSHRFDQPGTFDYQCSGAAPAQQAQVLVEEADSARGEKDNNILFLEGTFELKQNEGVDGWIIFEVPIGIKVRDLRWRAGDSITIRF